MIRILLLAFAIFLIEEVKEVFSGDVRSYRSQGLDGSVQRVSGICPQNRKTPKAPSRYLKKKNPIPSTSVSIESGKRLFNKDANPQPASSAMELEVMAVWQEGWTRLREILPAPK